MQTRECSVVSCEKGLYSLGMEEIEKKFRCPYCREKISMILDISIEDMQTYIEDCEVCCRPIQVTYSSENGKLTSFTAQAI